MVYIMLGWEHQLDASTSQCDPGSVWLEFNVLNIVSGVAYAYSYKDLNQTAHKMTSQPSVLTWTQEPKNPNLYFLGVRENRRKKN